MLFLPGLSGPRGPVELLALLAVAAAVIGWMLYQSSQRKKVAQSRAVLGNKLGLRTKQSRGQIVMDGDFRGFAVDVEMFLIRSGRAEVEMSRVQVFFPEGLRLGLQVTRRTLVGKLGKVLATTTKLGHKAFDTNFITVTRSGRTARRRLPEQLLRDMVRFVNSRGHLDLNDDGFCFETSGWIKENSKLTSILKQLVEMAGLLFPDSLEAPKKRSKRAVSRPPRKLVSKRKAAKPARPRRTNSGSRRTTAGSRRAAPARR